MSVIPLNARILFLSERPEAIEAQLAGQELSLVEAAPLRNDVSTDEITPTTAIRHFDERLAIRPYTGLKCGGRVPIPVGGVESGRFCVTVAGKRYGKGSSREQSPASELAAGIRLVIAESFERIYRQNADNVGLFTSTDFGLIERIQRGENITVDELVAQREPLAAAILKEGGLLRYCATMLSNVSTIEYPQDDRPRTLAEKILMRRALRTDATNGRFDVGSGAFTRPHWRFIHEVYSGMAGHLIRSVIGDDAKFVDPASIIGFADHFPYVQANAVLRAHSLADGMENLYRAHVQFCEDYGIISHGHLEGSAGAKGICHPYMTEHYALPGQVVVGTDSHTPHIGALGCVAFGVGTSDMVNAMLTGAVRFTVPDNVLILIDGVPPPGITAKDIVLYLLANPRLKAGAGVGLILEFAGTAVRAMSLDERATLTNMAAELGGFSGIVAPDEETVRFLRERRGIECGVEPWMQSDRGAHYAETISIDVSQLSPMVASPDDPGNAVPLSTVAVRPRIDIAFGGTCTGGKRADFDMYHEVLAWAARSGRTIAPGVRFFLQFGTVDVREYCMAMGYLDTFSAAGAIVLNPACGACANLGPGASERAGQVTVSAQNRNFPGRSGPGMMWLASPSTVAASAVAGRLVSFAELQREDVGNAGHSGDGGHAASRHGDATA